MRRSEPIGAFVLAAALRHLEVLDHAPGFPPPPFDVGTVQLVDVARDMTARGITIDQVDVFAVLCELERDEHVTLSDPDHVARYRATIDARRSVGPLVDDLADRLVIAVHPHHIPRERRS